MTTSEPGGPLLPEAGDGGRGLAALPPTDDIAEVVHEAFPPKAGASLGFADVLGVLGRARTAVDSGSAGAVVVQGTDTLEETAYLLDLYWDRSAPIVVTGAMRAPGQPGSDGPANLLAAITTAAASAAADLGALVVIADEIHSARRVVKADTSLPGAFASPAFGSLGRVSEGSVVFANRPTRRAPLPSPLGSPRVVLVEATLGDDLGLLGAADRSAFDGVVVAGTGAGHVPEGAVPLLEALGLTMPIVLASRTGCGPVLARTYGFPGSEMDLLRRGLLSAGWLSPRKARLLLWALLAAGIERDGLAHLLSAHGSAP